MGRLFGFLLFTHKFIDFKGVREGFAVPLKKQFQIKEKRQCAACALAYKKHDKK